MAARPCSQTKSGIIFRAWPTHSQHEGVKKLLSTTNVPRSSNHKKDESKLPPTIENLAGTASKPRAWLQVQHSPPGSLPAAAPGRAAPLHPAGQWGQALQRTSLVGIQKRLGKCNFAGLGIQGLLCVVTFSILTTQAVCNGLIWRQDSN